MKFQCDNTRNPFYFFGFFGVFLFATGLIMLANEMPAFSIPSGVFQKDYALLQEYEWWDKKYTGWLIASEKFQKENIEYGNIFWYFEVGRSTDWLITPYRSPARAFFKAPIFLLSGWTLFPLIWRISGLIVWIGFFMVLLKNSSYHIKILIFLSSIFFAPMQLFDQEFIFLYAQIVALFLYFSKHKGAYLWLHLIFWLYASNARIDYFYFFSLFNLYLLLHWITKKTYSKIFLVFSISALFIIGYLMTNKIYNGDYFTNSYVNSIGDLGKLQTQYFWKIETPIYKKILNIIIPGSFSIKEIIANIFYILRSYIWIWFVIFLCLFKKSKNTESHIFVDAKIFGIFVILIAIYGIVFYGSKGVENRPEAVGAFFYNVGSSSHARYFWVFIFVFWSMLYYKILIPGKIAKITYASFIIVFIFLWPHYHKIYNPTEILKEIGRMIPSNSVILDFRPNEKFLFTNYRTLYPIGDDILEFQEYLIYKKPVIFTWSYHTNSIIDLSWYIPVQKSVFLEKVSNYIIKTKTPVYILNRTFNQTNIDKLLDFFNSKQWLAVEKYNNSITILKVDTPNK